MARDVVKVNRAPVLTLWAAVVAVRLGYAWKEALSLARAVAGLNAQAKGRRLGIFGSPKAAEGGPARQPKKVGLGEEFWVELVGRPVPAKRTGEGVRAVVGSEPIEPDKVETYLKSKFGNDYEAVRQAMETLANSRGEDELAEDAYGMYETFRPKISAGVPGWGQKGELDLRLIRSLAK